MAPWPLFQFGFELLIFCVVLCQPGLYGHIFPEFSFSRWLSDCEGQPLSLGESFQSLLFNLKASWRVKRG